MALRLVGRREKRAVALNRQTARRQCTWRHMGEVKPSRPRSTLPCMPGSSSCVAWIDMNTWHTIDDDAAA